MSTETPSNWNLQQAWSIKHKRGHFPDIYIISSKDIAILSSLYVLKDASFEHVVLRPSCSWNCIKLLKIRPLFYQYVDCRTGNWTLNGGRFSVASVWEALRPHQLKVPWYRVIWSAPSIPKHNLVAWMMVQGRLPTKDRLQSWGMNVDPVCLLCQDKSESIGHLFYECAFSMEAWNGILELCNMHRVASFKLDWVLRCCKRKSLLASILRVAWKAPCLERKEQKIVPHTP